MSEKPKNKYEKAMRNAKASMELSGFHITEKHEELVGKVLNGEITEEQFHEKVMKFVKGVKEGD
ncbi:MAG: antitoxin VbhA family protein [Bacillus sp. (in: Bacteria)]|nr:antitoxin VbhA family protein [Bacillus sp. (in: firmicutes)]